MAEDRPVDTADEVERLRAENAALREYMARAGADATQRQRTVISAMLATLAAVCVVAAVPLVWFGATMLDTDRYVEAVAPLADDPQVREAAADVVADEVLARVDVETALEGVLPEVLYPVIPTVAEAFGGVVEQISSSSIESDAFSRLWTAGHREFHRALVAEYLGWLREASWVLLAVAIGLFGAGVAVSPQRAATLAWGAAAVAAGSALTVGFVTAVRGGLETAAATAAGQHAIRSMFSALTGSLLTAVWSVFGVALVVSGIAFAAMALRRRAA